MKGEPLGDALNRATRLADAWRASVEAERAAKGELDEALRDVMKYGAISEAALTRTLNLNPVTVRRALGKR